MPHLKICINKSIRPLILFHPFFIHVPDHLLTFTKHRVVVKTQQMCSFYILLEKHLKCFCLCARVHITESSLMPALPGDGDM